MILFASPEFETTAAKLCEAAPHLRPGCFRAGRFSNGELFVETQTPVNGEDCVVLGSIAPPDERLLSTLLLSHTLRRQGAKTLSALIPYLAYSRQDKIKPCHSLAAAWTGELMRASGFDRAISIDVHSREDQNLFPIPLISLSTAGIFAAAMNQYRLALATIVAPDAGAVPRCEAVRAAAGLPATPVSYFAKVRTETGIQHLEFTGEVGSQVLLVDDILDTGATLVSACQRLLCAGVEDIEIMVTHGLFTGDEWEELWELGVSRIFCTDTVPLRSETRQELDKDRIVVLPAVPLLAEALADRSRVGSLLRLVRFAATCRESEPI